MVNNHVQVLKDIETFQDIQITVPSISTISFPKKVSNLENVPKMGLLVTEKGNGITFYTNIPHNGGYLLCAFTTFGWVSANFNEV